MAVKYSGLLRFTDDIKVDIDLATDGTVEKAVVIDGDGVETPIGGGGDSDYTIAEVSITNNTNNELFCIAPNIANYGADNERLNSEVGVPKGLTKSFNMVLYKGRVLMYFVGENPPQPTCTGDIVNDGYETFVITGNGTITFGTAS